MVVSISLVTLAATALILFASKVKPETVVSGSVMKAGVVAVISILGIAWLGSTFFESHRTEILGAMSAYVQTESVALCLRAVLAVDLLYSQAATVAALMGVGLQLGVAPPLLIAMFPAVNGYFFLANLRHDRRRDSVRFHRNDPHRPVGVEP